MIEKYESIQYFKKDQLLNSELVKTFINSRIHIIGLRYAH